MTKRPKIINTIMLYFYGTILVILAVMFIGFNFAINNHLNTTLEDQLNSAKQKVADFQAADNTSQGMRRRAAFNLMLQEDTVNTNVNIMFLDSSRELTLTILDMMSGSGPQSQGGSGSMGMGMSMGNSSSEGYFMRLDSAAYKQTMSVYNYIKSTGYDLTSPAVVSAEIGGNTYYIKSIPFQDTQDNPEYVLAFIRVDMYTHFLGNVVRLLSLVMIPILILTFFIVRYLAKRLASPIGKLQVLSGRLGSGNFQGEDLNLRDQELADLNESLNETADKLKTYHDNQKIFFQNVSHELRTPLTSIRGYAEGIRYAVFDKDDASEVIMNESVKLEKLVDDILYLSRIESNESLAEVKTSLKLSDLLFEAREQVANDARINEKEVEVSFAQDPVIWIYYEELTRALVNLLSNGIRYAEKSIRMEGSIRGEDLVITVTDDGNGIEPGKEETIFKRFSKGAGGKHGIGLSITQAAILRHGGTVTAQNRRTGHGAEFTVMIPMKNLEETKS